MDVTDLKAFEAAVRKAETQYGPTECILNIAGMMLLGKAHTQDPAEWQSMINVNVIGVLHGIRVVIDNMMARKSGTVINMGSVAGRNTYANHGVYCASKFAVHALTETFREEYSKYNVRFVTIAPGIVKTELLSHTTDREIKADYIESNKDVEPLVPEDIANACWFAFNQVRSFARVASQLTHSLRAACTMLRSRNRPDSIAAGQVKPSALTHTNEECGLGEVDK